MEVFIANNFVFSIALLKTMFAITVGFDSLSGYENWISRKLLLT